MNVYVITHKPSGKCYVGQTVNPQKRIAEHVRTAGHTPSLIGRAIAAHGLDAFTVQVVALPDGSSRELANEIETRLIAHLGTIHPRGYNLASGGGAHEHHPQSVEKMRQAKLGKPRSPETNAKVSATLLANHPMRGVPFPEDRKQYLRDLFKGQKMSEEQKSKLRDAWARRKAEGRGTWTLTKEQRARLSAAKKGVSPSAETRARISATLKGRPLSAETRAKMSAARKGKPISEANRLAHCGHPCSPETREKIRQKKLERDARARADKAVAA